MALTFIALALLAVLCTVLGSLLGRVLRVPWLSSGTPHALPLQAALGSAALTCLCATVSHLGFGQGTSLVAVPVLLAVLAIAAWRGRRRPHRRRVRPLDWLPLLLALAAAGIVALLPIVHFDAFSFFNDGFYYNALSDWLVGHGVHELAPRTPMCPALAVVSQFQLSGVRLGTCYLQAFLTAATASRFAIFLFPAICCWGFLLLAGCVYSLGRVAFRLSPWLCAAAVCTMVCVPVGATYALQGGFEAQIYGLAALVAVLCATAAMIPRACRAAGSLLVLALLLAWQASAYSEMLPFAAVAVGTWLLLTLFRDLRRRESRRWLVSTGLVLVAFLVCSNLELVRAIAAIPMQAGAGAAAGWHVDPPGGSWLGLLTGWTRYPELLGPGATFNPMIVFGAPLVPVALALLGLLRRRSRPATHGTRAVVLVLVLLAAWFMLVARDPWTGARLQTWSTFKLMQWIHPFLMVAAWAGLAIVLRGPVAHRLAALVAAAMLVAGLPVHVRFAGMMSNNLLAKFTGSDRPLEELRRLGTAIDSLEGKQLYVATRPQFTNPLYVELLAFFTSRNRTAGLWTGCSYIYVPYVTWMSPELTDRLPKARPITVLAQRPHFDLPGGLDLGCGVQAVELGSEPVLCQVSAPDGLGRTHAGQPCAAIGSAPVTLVILAPRAGRVRLDGSVETADLRDTSLRRLLIGGDGQQAAEIETAGGTTHAIEATIELIEGINEVRIRPAEAPSPPTSDPRPPLLLLAPALRFE